MALTAEERSDDAVGLALALQAKGRSVPDAWTVAAELAGGLTGTVSPDAAALERNIAALQEQVERFARAYYANKLEAAGARRPRAA